MHYLLIDSSSYQIECKPGYQVELSDVGQDGIPPIILKKGRSSESFGPFTFGEERNVYRKKKYTIC